VGVQERHPGRCQGREPVDGFAAEAQRRRFVEPTGKQPPAPLVRIAKAAAVPARPALEVAHGNIGENAGDTIGVNRRPVVGDQATAADRRQCRPREAPAPPPDAGRRSLPATPRELPPRPAVASPRCSDAPARGSRDAHTRARCYWGWSRTGRTAVHVSRSGCTRRHRGSNPDTRPPTRRVSQPQHPTAARVVRGEPGPAENVHCVEPRSPAHKTPPVSSTPGTLCPRF